MSLTEEQITAKNFQEYHKRILPYLNGSFPTPIVNKFSKGDLYSTEEKIIGQWIDRKPIWQKTITGLSMPMAWDGQYCSKAFLQYDVSNIDKLIYAEGVGISGEQIANPTHCFSLGAYKTSTGIYFISFSGATLQQITLQYTKTTDSPISIGDGNDYSTDEQVVGTWIDGKPVYQRTFVASGSLALARAAWTDATTYFGVDVTVVGKIIDATLLNQDGTVNGMRIPLHFDLYQNKFQIYYDGGIQDTIVNAVLTLKYTKTTD